MNVCQCEESRLKAGLAMRMPTGVKRPAGNVRRIEVQRASIVWRCWVAQVGFEEWIRCGRSRRRKPRRDR